MRPAPTSDAILSSCAAAWPHSSGTCPEAGTPWRDNQPTTSFTPDNAAGRLTSSSDNFGDGDILGLAKYRQSVSGGAPGFGRVFPGDQNAPQIEPAAGVGNNQQWPSRLHHEIARIGLHEGIGKRVATVLSDDNNVGSACLLDDKSRRKILGTAPFYGRSTVLHRRAKLRFHLGDAVSDRCLILIKQLLGLLARREIERQTEFACGNSNDMGAEPFRELPGNLQPSVIRPVERQADDHCHIRHRTLPASRFTKAILDRNPERRMR